MKKKICEVIVGISLINVGLAMIAPDCLAQLQGKPGIELHLTSDFFGFLGFIGGGWYLWYTLSGRSENDSHIQPRRNHRL